MYIYIYTYLYICANEKGSIEWGFQNTSSQWIDHDSTCLKNNGFTKKAWNTHLLWNALFGEPDKLKLMIILHTHTHIYIFTYIFIKMPKNIHICMSYIVIHVPQKICLWKVLQLLGNKRSQMHMHATSEKGPTELSRLHFGGDPYRIISKGDWRLRIIWGWQNNWKHTIKDIVHEVPPLYALHVRNLF